MASCSFQTFVTSGDLSTYTTCPGTQAAISLPDNDCTQVGNVHKCTAMSINNASIVFTVTAVGTKSNRFTIESCNGYGSVSYDPEDVRTKLPLVGVIPDQCVFFNQTGSTNSTDPYADVAVTAEFALIGDYCKNHTASDQCEDYNAKATTPPAHSSATSSRWKTGLAVLLVGVFQALAMSEL